MASGWSLLRWAGALVGAALTLTLAGVAWDVYRLPARREVGGTLERLFLSDQAQRYGGVAHPLDAGRLWVGDWIRLTKVKRIAAAELLETADDYYVAAFLLQHGLSAGDFALAQRLASMAAELGHPHGRRLSAAAEDRYLVKIGQPQRYGSQMVCTAGKGWHLAPVDPSVDDTIRTARGMEPLAAMEARAARLNEALVGRCRLDAAGMRVFAVVTGAARPG